MKDKLAFKREPTAECFFARLGYSRADKNTAPEQIKRTKEFSGLCSDSSTFMVKKLDG